MAQEVNPTSIASFKIIPAKHPNTQETGISLGFWSGHRDEETSPNSPAVVVTVFEKTAGTSRKPRRNLAGTSAVSSYGHISNSFFYLLKNPVANSY